MADKMQPGRFTLRFNMNDPQQQAAVEILNRMGRQKAQFIAQALTHYTECKCHTQVENQPTWDEPALDGAAEGQDAPQEQAEEPSSEQNGSMTEAGLNAINKTLSAFWNQ